MNYSKEDASEGIKHLSFTTTNEVGKRPKMRRSNSPCLLEGLQAVDGSLAPWDEFRLADCSSKSCDVHINPREYSLFRGCILNH